MQGEKDQEGRNRQASWYYFEVNDAPQTELILDLIDLPGEYNYTPNKGAITNATPPVISYDGKTWKHLEAPEYDQNEPRLRLRIVPEKRRFRIAHVPPYTSENLQKLRREVSGHHYFDEEIVGKTLGGRDLVLWTIHQGEGKDAKTVWLMFRQHSWESGSSWVGEGVVRALLAETADAAKLRRDVIWKIFPLCDPDGVARGGVRFNAKGFDLNRNWDIKDPIRMPEITAQRDAIKKWLEKGNTVDFYLSLHNTETSEYLEGPPNDKGEFKPLAERLFQILTSETSFSPSRPLFYGGKTTTAGKLGRMNVIQGLYTDFRVPGFLMEQHIGYNEKLGHFPNIRDRLHFGEELVRAITMAVIQ